MEEVWKDIEGYEGLYQVSNFGNVRSLNWRNTGKAKNLFLKEHKRGYYHVELKNDEGRKAFLVHRLVASAFIENPNNYPNINHKDENKRNNSVENLEWCTCSYNVRYSLKLHPERHAYNGGHRKGCRYKGKNSGKKIVQLTLDGTLVKEWISSRTIFIETGMSDWSISECCRGKRHKVYGYIWQYADEYIAGREVR